MSTLSDFEDELESSALAQLGDPITYTPNGGEALSLHAWVNYDTGVVATPNSRAIVTQIEVEVAAADVATPTKEDRLTLPRLPGKTYRPARIERGRMGNTWVLGLTETA